MKHPYAFVVAPEAPSRKAEQSERDRNAKMDLFLRKVNGSARYDATSIETRAVKTPEQGKPVA